MDWQEVLEKYPGIGNNAPERLKCIICEGILKHAKQTPCGCKMCQKCHEKLTNKGIVQCPGIGEECKATLLSMNIILPSDIATMREISMLMVKCPFETCESNLICKEMAIHVEKCDFRISKCNQCQEIIFEKELIGHQKQRCKYRITECPFCDIKINAQNLEDEHLNGNHTNVCDKYEDYCPNKCGETLRVNMQKHMETCTRKPTWCPFNPFGCTKGKMMPEEIKKHTENENAQHQAILIETMRRFKSQIEKMENELLIQKEVTAEIRKVEQTTMGTVDKLNTNVKKMLTENKINPSYGPSTSIFRNGELIWKIEELSTKIAQAKGNGPVSWTSESFYSSEFGYRLCMKIYPDGDGVGKGKYLAVYFTIMKGDYDDLLTWPFKLKTTLSILDQTTRGLHQSISFRPDGHSPSFNKPTEFGNVASGAPKFVLLTSVAEGASFNPHGTIYLKMEVETI